MTSIHFIAGHTVMVVVVLLALASTLALSFRMDSGRRRGRRLGDPLEADLVRRWNARTPRH